MENIHNSAELEKKRKVRSLTIGILTHTSFAFAVAYMFISLYSDFLYSIGKLEGTQRILLNSFLLIQFPLVHSLLLTRKGRQLLSKPWKRLSSTWFVFLSSIDLFLTFALWSPDKANTNFLSSNLLVQALFIASWMFLIRAIYDSGMALQTGYTGWSAEYKNVEPTYPKFREHGLFKLVRHPIYLGFFLIILFAPFWNLDKIILLSLWGTYCLLGPFFKEKRLINAYGEKYLEYRKRVPYFIPWRF